MQERLYRLYNKKKNIQDKPLLVNIDKIIFLTQKCIQLQKMIKEKRAEGSYNDADCMSKYLLDIELQIVDICPHNNVKILPPSSIDQEPDTKCLDCGGILKLKL